MFRLIVINSLTHCNNTSINVSGHMIYASFFPAVFESTVECAFSVAALVVPVVDSFAINKM